MTPAPLTTRAAYVERLGAATEIRYGDLAIAGPGPTDVLVAVDATVVNPVDTFVRSGAYPTPVPLPFVIGRDLVGTVVAAGPGAPGFAAGDRVWCNSLGHDGRQGAAAERAVVPVDRLYRLPDGVPAELAVAVVHPTATAYLALFTHGRLRPGDTVVVAGAAGNVGSALVVLASTAGARVVATAAADDEAYCRSLGAAEVLDYRDERWPERVRALCPDGVDLYLDTYGRNDLENAVELLAHRGRVVLLAGLRTRPVLPAGSLYTRDGAVVGFVISRASTAELGAAARMINQLLAAGRLRPRGTEILSLREAAEAHRRVEAGKLRGTRLVLAPGC
ncbi:NADPH:quinone reductase [Plantactinospora sp. ZYX-F-223]|uniref:NADPH:quinone reductase n=1 Tax=Plantactinospora sp. ZYX-F-223 TaxID=3144103 RepID=UPI0031FC204C